MSNKLFERLVIAAQQREVIIANSDEARYIRRLSNDDADLMASADACALVVSRHVRIVRISHDDHVFFCVFGLAEADIPPLMLQPIELTPALFTISVLEAEVQPLRALSGSEIRNAIEDNFIGTDGYIGHELSTMEKLFPRIVAYKVERLEPYLLEGEHRVLGALLARSYEDGPLHIFAETLECLWLMFESGSKYIPYRNLVQGVMAISWEGLYLETYRCLEQLYAAPRIKALESSWSSSLPLRSLAVLLEQHLPWRPKEDESLEQIFAECDQILQQRLYAAFPGAVVPNEITILPALVARKVYSLRNSIVHYRPIHDVVQLTNEEWNLIVSSLLAVVNQVYEDRADSFFEGKPPLVGSQFSS